MYFVLLITSYIGITGLFQCITVNYYNVCVCNVILVLVNAMLCCFYCNAIHASLLHQLMSHGWMHTDTHKDTWGQEACITRCVMLLKPADITICLFLCCSIQIQWICIFNILLYAGYILKTPISLILQGQLFSYTKHLTRLKS